MSTTVIDVIFDRLLATYGRGFTDLYSQADSASVRAAWAREVSPFASRPQVIHWALANLPERCPNAVQFRALCRQAPRPQEPRLPEPVANKDRARRELARLREAINRPPSTSLQRTLERIEQNPHAVSPTVRQMALAAARRLGT